ncbi:HAD family hydrolase [Candidatus Nomurabacteria bacterium]|nr:HAD family hydrolase [Candidatus Nomurabacteria bacterium]
MIKNIIFDWSGVINDSVEANHIVANKILEEFGVNEISLEEYKNNWEQPFMLFYNKYLPNLTLEEEKEAYGRLIKDRPQCQPFHGIIKLLKEFKEKGIKMVILSSDFPETLLPQISSFGLDGIFIDIVTDVHDKLEGIKKLIEKNSFAPDETIFIGDSNHEIEVGKIVGVKTGAVTWGYCTKEKLASLDPDFLINDLDELRNIILTK